MFPAGRRRRRSDGCSRRAGPSPARAGGERRRPRDVVEVADDRDQGRAFLLPGFVDLSHTLRLLQSTRIRIHLVAEALALEMIGDSLISCSEQSRLNTRVPSTKSSTWLLMVAMGKRDTSLQSIPRSSLPSMTIT